MRISLHIYVHILGLLLRDAKSEKELRDGVDAFLYFVQRNNDIAQIKKIVERFMHSCMSKEILDYMAVEFASAGEEAIYTPHIRSLTKERTRSIVLESHVNPRIMNGVRIVYNNTYLIEATIDAMIHQLLHPSIMK